jgi:hypothetical protein
MSENVEQLPFLGRARGHAKGTEPIFHNLHDTALRAKAHEWGST